LHFFGYDVNIGTLIAAACVQVLLIMILICIQIFQSHGYFNLVKWLKRIGYILLSVTWLLSLPVMYIYTGAAQCNFETGMLHRYEDMECHSTINVIQMIAGAIVVFNALTLGSIAVLM
jgi:hypothetical protein